MSAANGETVPHGTCGTCRFSDLMMIEDGDLGETPHLICRRMPPTMVTWEDAASPTWPVVHDNEWCGEFT
jgi:hypothetical protein